MPPEHIRTTIQSVVDTQESVFIKFGSFEADVHGVYAIGALLIGVLAIAVFGKKLINGKKTGSPVNASGSKPVCARDIEKLSAQFKEIAESLGEGIDKNRAEIKKVGEGVVRLEERTENLESDVKEAREDIKKLQRSHHELKGRVENSSCQPHRK